MSSPSSPEQGAGPAGGRAPAPGSVSCLAALGRRLRQARQARGLAVNALADRLRIGVEQLEALETANRERLPEPVFVIAHARRIAAVLELDITAEVQALRASDELQPWPWPRSPRSSQALEAAPPAVTAADPATDRKPGAHTTGARRAISWLASARARPLLVGGVLLLALAGVWGGWRLRGGGPFPHGATEPSPAAAPAGRPGT